MLKVHLTMLGFHRTTIAFTIPVVNNSFVRPSRGIAHELNRNLNKRGGPEESMGEKWIPVETRVKKKTKLYSTYNDRGQADEKNHGGGNGGQEEAK